MNIHEKLREIRREKNMTLTEVAEGMGLAYSTIQSWETGRVEPPMEKLQRLCDVYGISPLDLLEHRPSYDDVQSVLEIPMDERTLEQRITAAFSREIIDEHQVHIFDGLRKLHSTLTPEQKEGFKAAEIAQIQKVQDQAMFIQRTDLLKRYGGRCGTDTVSAAMAAYKDSQYDEDILFAYHALTDEGKESLLRILDACLFASHKPFVTDQALTFTRDRLKAARGGEA